MKSFFLESSGVMRKVDYASFAGLAGMEIILAEDFFLFFSNSISGLLFCLSFFSLDLFLGVRVLRKGLLEIEFLSLF